jgi:hypothetical protein
MRDEKKEPWVQLCEQAAVEPDPGKLLELVTEINRLLEEKELKEERLKREGNSMRDIHAARLTLPSSSSNSEIRLCRSS